MIMIDYKYKVYNLMFVYKFFVDVCWEVINFVIIWSDVLLKLKYCYEFLKRICKREFINR